MKKLLLLIPLLFISACTLIAPKTEVTSEFLQWEQHKTQLTALNHWQMQSRAFIQAKDQGFSSSIQWQQQDEDYKLRFTAPFSQGIYHLNGSPENVTILLPDNTQQSAKDAESLLVDTLGFKLPVNGLKYWMRGLPYPDDPDRKITLDSNERLAKLEQAGWQIEISRYIHKSGYYLPTKLTMKNKYLKLKMVVKEWTLANPSE